SSIVRLGPHDSPLPLPTTCKTFNLPLSVLRSVRTPAPVFSSLFSPFPLSTSLHYLTWKDLFLVTDLLTLPWRHRLVVSLELVVVRYVIVLRGRRIPAGALPRVSRLRYSVVFKGNAVASFKHLSMRRDQR